jgi:plasmid stability protein
MPVPVNLSIKNVPDELVEMLRARAKRNHRSLQGELMFIIEAAVTPAKLSLEDAESVLKGLDLETGEDSSRWVRELRDAR